MCYYLHHLSFTKLSDQLHMDEQRTLCIVVCSNNRALANRSVIYMHKLAKSSVNTVHALWGPKTYEELKEFVRSENLDQQPIDTLILSMPDDVLQLQIMRRHLKCLYTVFVRSWDANDEQVPVPPRVFDDSFGAEPKDTDPEVINQIILREAAFCVARAELFHVRKLRRELVYAEKLAKLLACCLVTLSVFSVLK